MTKKHFIRAAEIVKAISEGRWTREPPLWADAEMYGWTGSEIGCWYDTEIDYTRAVQTAEAFIILAQAFNHRFDVQRFLVACGLVEPVVKKRGKCV